MQKPKAILFDWDNTLADSWPIIHDALNKTFVSMGHEPWPLKDVIDGREGIHHSLRDSFPRLFGDAWEKARQEYYKHFLAVHLERIAPLEGAEQTLQSLHDSDIYVAIVSNKTGDYLRKEVEHLGWTHYFDAIVGATDAKEDKPSGVPLHFALENSGIEAGPDVWMVGDSATDIHAALNANCDPHLYGHYEIDDAVLTDSRLKKPVKRYINHTELHGTLSQIL